ncbi:MULTISPECIES: ABC transporter ATP-binding protein [unclassified Clostridioides]|uniref:ABC transporter ATP-binding protein n=1 Tax=unclassified Clostridioides TaxID=2635829 RepID=UPI0006BBC636|nr:ABC transporter ATP-binding protein [Clostridioides difficile]MCC0692249.1 ABC transporter ATP-binding protein [Clostridioides sp. ZZV14-6387]MCI9974962.1 ABC transporter ATP-binding protein [Clostridioides difficile]MDB3085183.1 ABC transporter ATP-binding protein [Clostridioides difficile]MDI0266829.1 ABC transporter ATP-binding protein [Clostridioides difficile]
MFIEINNLCKSYKSEDIETIALKNANISLNKGEIGVILGPSGSGKSTLMNILGGLDSADSGEVIVDGIDIVKLSDDELVEYRREKTGFIFQSYNLIPHLTVLENIEIIQNISKSPLDINEVLESVGLIDKKNRFPRELSGGQQQRVAVARAIIKNPAILLCDELTGALDYESAIDVLSLVQEINRKFNTTILIITHNAAIGEMANRIYKFRSGEVKDYIINNDPIDAKGVEW